LFDDSRVSQTPKIIFTSRGNSAYENVYGPEKVDNGECNSLDAKLLSRKFICKDLIYVEEFLL
jgi:hypothetical protein